MNDRSEKSNLRPVWAGMALASFLAALYFGLLGSLVGLAGWIVLGALGVLFVVLAFPNTWNYLSWLGLSYVLTWGGLVTAQIFAPESGSMRPVVFAAGLVMLAFGYGTVAFFIYHMKKIRDRLCGLIPGEEGTYITKRQRYVPMGLWAAASIFFFVFTAVSAYGWISWATSNAPLYTYIAGDVLAVLLMFYVLWVPQEKLNWGSYYRDFPTTYDAKVDRGITSFIASIALPKPLRPGGFFVGRRVRGRTEEGPRPGGEGASHVDANTCPVCSAPVKKTTKKCPHCGNTMRFTYCLKEEGIIVRCPHCGGYVRYGAERCRHCGKVLSKMVVCSKCGYKGPITSWR